MKDRRMDSVQNCDGYLLNTFSWRKKLIMMTISAPSIIYVWHKTEHMVTQFYLRSHVLDDGRIRMKHVVVWQDEYDTEKNVALQTSVYMYETGWKVNKRQHSPKKCWNTSLRCVFLKTSGQCWGSSIVASCCTLPRFHSCIQCDVTCNLHLNF
jgi:hypothetical protein